MKKFGFALLAFMLFISSAALIAQQVPFGINYQAVARDSYGDELTSRIIDVKFTVVSGTPLGVLEYQEVHSGITTSKYGVFSVIIGKGTPLAGRAEQFSEISWDRDPHYLKVEIKFSSEFVDLGTMQFLSVPYALYAGRSLEPGPEGPPGPPGDPATDDQTLSFDGENLSIAGGNTVNLANLLDVDDADADPKNEIQDLRIENDSLRITMNPEAVRIGLSNYKQRLTFNSTDKKLAISNGNEVDLSILTNTDNQELFYNPVTHVLTILNGTNSIDLDNLKNDADADPANELISNVAIEGTELVITEGSNQKRIDLSSNVIAFRAKKNLSQTGLSIGSNYDFIADNIEYNVGGAYNESTGVFTAPLPGIYTFNLGYLATGVNPGRELYIYHKGILYEKLRTNIVSGDSFLVSATLKLSANDVVKIVFYTGLSTESGTGSFSGFKVF